jgi:hypothetical protein
MNEIRSHDYVNHPYAAVRDALVKDPAAVLSAARMLRPRARGTSPPRCT